MKPDIILIFLDWEKAFDKVSHTKLFESLERLNLHPKILCNIKALYKTPKFRTRHGNDTSEWKTQHSGIRQGFPLSPYLFILLMHVLFANFNSKNNDPQNRKTLQGLNFHELLYADDTLVVAKNTKTAKTYLKLIEDESEYFNMKLNKDKCTYIASNKNNKIIFRDGTLLKSVDKTTYLGTEIAKRVDPGLEISRRICLTPHFWKNFSFSGNKRTVQRNGKYKSSSQSASPIFHTVSKR